MATYWSLYWSYITNRLEFVFALLSFDSGRTSFSAKLSIRMNAAPSIPVSESRPLQWMPCVVTLERPGKIESHDQV